MTDNNNPLLPVPVTKPTAKHQQRSFQGIPGFTITSSGHFLACWYGGGQGEGPDNYVMVKTSADQGRTWQGPVAVIDPPGRNVRAFDPTLWTDPAGKVWLFWAQSHSPAQGTIADGVNGVWGATLCDLDRSLDHWSAPIRISDGIMMNKPTVLADGTWALPVSIWAPGVGGGQPPSRLQGAIGANLVASSDQGKTFVRRGGFHLPKSTFDEHHFIERRDGSLWALNRMPYGVGQAFSTNGGQTWKNAGPSTIPGPSSRFFITRLRSGRLLLVNHRPPAGWVSGEAPPSWRGRSHLCAWLSEDDGQTWQGGLLLDERNAVSYPDGCQDQSGRIWIIYDHDRQGRGEILLTSCTEEDIISNANQCQQQWSYQVVDHLVKD